jgi:hypothetical protein
MRRLLQTVYRGIIPKRIGIETLASIHRIARIGERHGCREASGDDAGQRQQASCGHLSGLTQKAKSRRGPMRTSLYRRSGTFDVRASYNTVVVSDTLLAKLYFKPTSTE